MREYADDRRREEGDHDICDEALRERVRGQSQCGMREPLAVDPTHGEDRAQLDDDVEQFAFRPLDAEQAVGEDQVPGR